MFFDTEWEHAYLRMRLGPHHPRLTTVTQDPARTALYTLALHLSLVAGPLQKLARPHCPDPEQMRAIAQTHLTHTLAAS
ncbi:hypothetical protein [Nocardiopsis kunsanensis]|uniref:hypothetical protein n=1 Tax=Nocardiopsis kunsanensis TaxID=141693 RepID=UPI00034496BE|nr:hypothetical protein [Nocardiopsis kunsanensis]